VAPAGRVHASLPDWAKFVADHIRGERGDKALLKAESYKKLHRPALAGSNYSVGGWNVNEKDSRVAGLVLAHDGSNDMNYSSAWLAPGRDIAILVTCNQGSQAGSKACHEARQFLVKHYLKEP
jgi:hypothetical protein